MFSSIFVFYKWILADKLRRAIATFISILAISFVYFSIKGYAIPLLRLVIAVVITAILFSVGNYYMHGKPNDK